jgi:hypothetical protein
MAVPYGVSNMGNAGRRAMYRSTTARERSGYAMLNDVPRVRKKYIDWNKEKIKKNNWKTINYRYNQYRKEGSI